MILQPDGGLQPERTALSWSRTGASGLAVAALGAKALGGARLDDAAILATAVVAVIACTGALVVRSSRVRRRPRHRLPVRTGPSARRFYAASIGVVVVGVWSLVLLVLLVL